MLQLIVTTTMMRLVVGRTLATIMEEDTYWLLIWWEQFVHAVTLESPESRKMDSVCLRFIRIFFNSIIAPWKLLFAFVPTYQIARGWIAFICSLVFISGIAYGVTKLTNQISCVTGVSPYVIAFAALAAGKRATQMIRLHAEYQASRAAQEEEAGVCGLADGNGGGNEAQETAGSRPPNHD